MMNGSPVCYSRMAIRRRRAGGEEEFIEQRVRMPGSMEHVLYMYDGGAMRFPRGYLPVVR
jgi:hypothetical protein